MALSHQSLVGYVGKNINMHEELSMHCFLVHPTPFPRDQLYFSTTSMLAWCVVRISHLLYLHISVHIYIITGFGFGILHLD